jgi:hypothetical protein
MPRLSIVAMGPHQVRWGPRPSQRPGPAEDAGNSDVHKELRWGLDGVERVVFHAIVVMTTGGAILVVPRTLVAARDDVRPAEPARGLLGHPGTWLVAVVSLLYMNQVLFTVYLLRVHHGDPSFIARYLPPGWFALAGDNPLLQLVARSFPAPGLLSICVLRVQAFLELPFVVLAYLTACRWFDRGLYEQLVASPLLWLVAASWTATFCLIEWSLPNPYTGQDLAIRAAAAVVVSVGVRQLGARRSASRPPDGPLRPVAGAVGLLAFLASAAALGYLVLAVYDTALVYNLGHLGSWLPGIGVALVILGTARTAARHFATGTSRPGIDTLVSSLWWLLALFFVPALPIRYELGFGSPWLARLAFAAIVLVAAAYGAREAFGRLPAASRRGLTLWVWAFQMAVTLTIGIGVGGLASRWRGGYVEVVLLRAAVLSAVSAIAVCALLDRVTHHSPADDIDRPAARSDVRGG